MGKREIQDLESGLGSMVVVLPKEDGSDPLHFFKEGYPGLLWRYEQAKSDVAELGLTDLVEATIRDCLALVQQGRRKDAQDLLLATSSTLSEKSGTWDEMRRMYTASNDPSVR
jgi:hypothetical protein